MNFIKRINKPLLYHLMAMFCFFISLLYVFPLSVNILVQKFSEKQYGDSPAMYKYKFLLCIIYVVATYNLNMITLSEIKKWSWNLLLIQILIDGLLIPFSIFCIILYNNTKSTFIQSVDSLINVYLIILLLATKHIVLLLIYRKHIDKKQ